MQGKNSPVSRQDEVKPQPEIQPLTTSSFPFFSTPTGKLEVKDSKNLSAVITELEQIHKDMNAVPGNSTVFLFNVSFDYAMKRLKAFNGASVDINQGLNPEEVKNAKYMGCSEEDLTPISQRLRSCLSEKEKLYDLFFKEHYIWTGTLQTFSNVFIASPLLGKFGARFKKCLEEGLEPLLATPAPTLTTSTSHQGYT